jgi:hypothetical protein
MYFKFYRKALLQIDAEARSNVNINNIGMGVSSPNFGAALGSAKQPGKRKGPKTRIGKRFFRPIRLVFGRHL